MVCEWCRNKRHEACVNDTEIIRNIVVKRDTPIKTCVCQHKKSWNYVESVTQETKDTNGDRKES